MVSARKLGCGAGVLAVLVCGSPLHAQDAGGEGSNGPEPGVYQAGRGLGNLFTRPLHPIVQTVASGGGLGVGIGYDFPTSEAWQVGAKAVVTPRRYWMAEFDAVYAAGRWDGGAYARARHMNALNFFGSGNDTIRGDQTKFTLRDPVAGVGGSFRVARGVALGGRAEMMWPSVRSGRDSDLPSIEQRFGELQAPGLSTQPTFGRYQVFAQATAPAAAGWDTNQGGTYRMAWDVYNDLQGDRFGFRRVQVEGRHKFAMVRPYHSLTLHGWVSSAEASSGQQVPFFLQHTLGGVSHIRSVHESLIGTDGTTATLRGFPNLRFRGDHLLLLQAEYRFGLWGPVDATIFVDAGKAVQDRSQLNLSALNKDVGFSVSFMHAAATVARADVGFGPEGPRIYFSLGGLLP